MATLIPPEELLSLYSTGWFPMAMADGSIRCFSPDPRGILPLEAFHIPHGARKALRDPQWEVRQNTSFAQVVRACSHRRETWIDETIVQSYIRLHQAGHAHSLEIWRHGLLVGGLYGVIIGGAFFGESMFHQVAGASKVALVTLVERLREAGFQLLDTQWTTPHLVQFGAVSIPRREYLHRLQLAIRAKPKSLWYPPSMRASGSSFS
jgi:leucyl/phenylalanyl-tRNA---protein transferase